MVGCYVLGALRVLLTALPGIGDTASGLVSPAVQDAPETCYKYVERLPRCLRFYSPYPHALFSPTCILGWHDREECDERSRMSE